MSNAWHMCTCTDCGSSHICTPWDDFYAIPNDAGALLCEGCFRTHIGRPITVFLTGDQT